MPITGDSRGYTAGKYQIELDGINAGWVQSVEGGGASADVVTEKIGADHYAKKHIGNVKYEPITVICGTGMTKGFYDWINASFTQAIAKQGRKNGAVMFAGHDYEVISRLEFQHALMSEFGMPALDAASKDPAKMTCKFECETTRLLKGDGKKIAGASPIDSKKQKNWLPSNFRLKIDGLDKGCSRVNKIEALTIKQKVTENPCGELRDYEKEPGHLEVPNLVITLADSHTEEFAKWHEDFVIKGNCTEDKEKGGSLEYLASDLKTVLFTLNFKHLGIFKMTAEKVEAGSEQIRRTKVEMYCEEMQWDYRSSWA
jgi:phage tail-like protein